MASNILIVEPDPGVSKEMCDRLRSFGFVVKATDRLDNAVNIGAVLNPDLVVIDHSLTDLTSAVDQRVDLQWIGDAALILVADGTDAQASVSAKIMGASNILTQPLSGNDLLDSVSHALWSSREAANDPAW